MKQLQKLVHAVQATATTMTPARRNAFTAMAVASSMGECARNAVVAEKWLLIKIEYCTLETTVMSSRFFV